MTPTDPNAPVGTEAERVISILGWIFLTGGALAYIGSLASNAHWIYWVQILAIGFAVLGFGMLKTTGAL